MLTQSTLASELEALTPTQSEATGIERFVEAFATYFEGATVNGIPVTAAALTGARTAMSAALVGIGAGGGAAKIQAGVVAFWAAVSASAAAVWPGHSPPVTGATPPPGLSGLAAALEVAFAANIAARAELGDAVAAIAAAMHPLQLGGIAAVGPPSATFPIL